MNNNTNKVELKIGGMNCSNCALGIKRQLEKDGYKEVTVNFATSEAGFVYDNKHSLQKAKDRILSMGYTIVEDEDKEAPEGFSYMMIKFAVSLVFTVPLLISMFLPYSIFHEPYFQLLLAIPVFAIGLWHFGKSAYYSLKTGVPNMDVLIIIGSAAAFIYSLYGTINNLGHYYQFYETTASIITLVLLGNLLEERSVKQTTSAFNALVKLQKTKAKRITISNGNEITKEVNFSEIQINDILLVNTGDKIPVDGNICWGYGSLDESLISGESIPVDKTEGNKVVGGTILVSGSIKIQAVAVGKETVLSQIIEMVKQAQQDKPSKQNLADKVSAVFVPLVVSIAIITFIVSYWLVGISFQPALMHSIAVLVIACPCALGLAIPTAVVVGIGRVAKNGILIKGGSTLEEFANIKRIVFDKTGTLTTGKHKITRFKTIDFSEEYAKSVLLSMEKHSSHPIAKSIVKEFENSELFNFKQISEIKGIGIEAEDFENNIYKAGSYNIVKHITDDDSHTVYLVFNDKLVAWIDIEDEIKPETKKTIEFLKSKGITTVLLSGDRKQKCVKPANELGIDEVYYEKNPEEKFKIVEDFAKAGSTAMVGDGINDAPALAKATVGISLSDASHIAIKSAKIILLNGNLSLLPKALLISRNTMKIIKQNLFWAFFYNVIAIPIAAVGLLNPMIAAASMAFSDIFVVFNSLRLRNKKL